MADATAIEWAEATLNPWTGCTKVSPGCAHCYIERTPPFRVAGRAFVGGHIPLVFHMDRLEKVLRRKRPTLYFVNSLSDLFHEDASDEQIAEVFATMARAHWHTFQVLTKRPERMAELLGGAWFRLCWAGALRRDGLFDYATEHVARYGESVPPWPIPNVWLGVSIENRRFVGRADVLRETPAAVRFISAEPLLGPLVHAYGVAAERGFWRDGSNLPPLDLHDIDWLIVGGESGPGHRPMRLEWARDLVAAARAAGCAPFLKQLGGARPGTKLEDLPEDLRVREFPTARTREGAPT